VIQAWLIIICLMIVAGLVFRVAQRNLPPVLMRKVSPEAASRLVTEFIAGSYDDRFGYPSGYFEIQSADGHQIVAQEFVARGSHFTDILKGMFVAVLGVGEIFGCIGGLIALVVAAFLAPVFIYAALAETLLKYLLRSRIVSSLQPSPDGTMVSFTLRGPVALLIGLRLERAFHAPVLPSRVAALAGVPISGGAISGGAIPVPGGTGPAAALDAANDESPAP
jgi:hypothetical protein